MLALKIRFNLLIGICYIVKNKFSFHVNILLEYI